MNAPFRWTFPIIALLATIAAVVLNDEPIVAIPAATIAVAAGAMTLWDSVRPPAPQPGAELEGSLAAAPVGNEVWFEGGEMGQEAIVLLLDRIDRALLHPALPNRSSGELTQLRTLPRDQFLGYLESRMAELEAVS
ncbi:MAG TPA: hypothetical protein VML94_02610 [Thermoplasmata archaeon]|nr:hypothetical protein [Thermoplasmata archaeon]